MSRLDFRDPAHERDEAAPCEWCGAVWVDTPEAGHGAREMTHRLDCRWLLHIEDEL